MCSACSYRRRRVVFLASPERTAARAKSMRAWNLKQYGLTPAVFEIMRAAQKNKCAICKTVFTTKGKHAACVDHRHSDGKVRGLLCRTCNAAIGLLKESSVIVARAALYLK